MLAGVRSVLNYGLLHLPEPKQNRNWYQVSAAEAAQ
jgi:hypothetical protein